MAANLHCNNFKTLFSVSWPENSSKSESKAQHLVASVTKEALAIGKERILISALT